MKRLSIIAATAALLAGGAVAQPVVIVRPAGPTDVVLVAVAPGSLRTVSEDRCEIAGSVLRVERGKRFKSGETVVTEVACGRYAIIPAPAAAAVRIPSAYPKDALRQARTLRVAYDIVGDVHSVEIVEGRMIWPAPAVR